MKGKAVELRAYVPVIIGLGCIALWRLGGYRASGPDTGKSVVIAVKASRVRS